MDNPQYKQKEKIFENCYCGFKPYYKWITLNTIQFLVIFSTSLGFKPYYKWITLNTIIEDKEISLTVEEF